MKKLGFDLIILGAPVSGKDTQAEFLTHAYNVKLVRSGEYVRKSMKRKDWLGKLMRKTVGKAKPAPVAVIKEFLKDELRKAPKTKSLVFVGNPKLKPEAQFLVKLLKKNKRDFFVLYLKLSPKEIISRSYFRMRHDDATKTLINRRISWHKKQVGKTVDYFRAMKRLKIINGEQNIVSVTRDIQKAINDYQRSKRD